MMDWTDRHCRAFHRRLSRHARLYTEMVTAQAVIHGDRDRLLGFDAAEHPVALQLGGSEPGLLARAARIGADRGYDEINLNCGCPSDRVQSGCFGAALMATPARVADCVRAMQDATGRPVTVKCRIGIDDQDPARALPDFLSHVAEAGVTHVIIHARKAWLKGLSPKENREIPPLDYHLALAMTRDFPGLTIALNGGITTLDAVRDALGRGFAGVMVGRAAYHDPFAILGRADSLIFGAASDPCADPVDAALAMRGYIADHIARGGRLHQVTRHMLGLFHGRPGARGWRQTLSDAATLAGGLAAYDAACATVSRRLAA
jgi:tRNA-dihydrouridine synthase A